MPKYLVSVQTRMQKDYTVEAANTVEAAQRVLYPAELFDATTTPPVLTDVYEAPDPDYAVFGIETDEEAFFEEHEIAPPQ